jgi:hypothetical protein
MQSTSDFTPTTDLINGSPKNMVTYFLLNRCNEFSRDIKQHDNVDVSAMTADLLSYCPEITRREKMWQDFTDRKADTAVESNSKKRELNAAILTKGDFWAYICEVLEFTERSTGGF